MKKMITAIIVLLCTINTVFSKDYKCIAILNQNENIKEVELKVQNNSSYRTIKLNSINFDAVEANDNSLTLSIYQINNEKKFVSAYTVAPDEKRGTWLTMNLSNGSAQIYCYEL